MTKPSRLLNTAIQAIVAVTRYPVEVLSPEADLENDLGIDSVKLVEILVALGKEVNIDLMKHDRDPSVRTIEQLSEWLEDLVPEENRAYEETEAEPASALNGAAVLRSQQGTETQRRAVQSVSTIERLKAADKKSIDPIRTDIRTDNGSQSSSWGSQSSSWRTKPAPLNGKSGNGVSRTLNPPHVTLPGSEGSRTIPSQDSREDMPIDDQQLSLRDRVAFVTGSGRGVGRTIARLLAKKGATVIVNSFHSREAGEKTTADIIADGGRAFHLWGSIANANHVDNIFDEIGQRIGQLDILVCNASDGRIGAFTEVSSEDWERAFRTNVIGHYQCAMRASRLMQRQGGGAIITMSSIAARKYVEGLGGQGVVKAAVESLTRHLACELSPLGIRTNCVSGGPVYGQVMSLYPEARSTMNYWETLVLDNELCSPLDLAHTVAFLASDDARGVNGAVWNVDHGLSTRSHSRPLPKAMNQAAHSSIVAQ